jgi:hypothetical protein
MHFFCISVTLFYPTTAETYVGLKCNRNTNSAFVRYNTANLLIKFHGHIFLVSETSPILSYIISIHYTCLNAKFFYSPTVISFLPFFTQYVLQITVRHGAEIRMNGV